MNITYTADIPEDLDSQIAEAPHGHMPFFYPSRLNEADLCYFATGHIRYRENHTLLRGQCAMISNPTSNWFEHDLSYIMYVLAGCLSLPDQHGRRKVQIAQAGSAGSGADTLSMESARYSFRLDCSFGFTGVNAEMLHPLNLLDVFDMVEGDAGAMATAFTRRQDGGLPFTPKFYREINPGENPRTGYRLYDVITRKWLQLMPVQGLFLPFVKKEEDFLENLERAELSLMRQDLNYGASLYVATDTFALPGHDGIGSSVLAKHVEGLEKPYKTDIDPCGEEPIIPGWCKLPRAQGPDKYRHNALRSIMNANGLHVWQRALR
jgi:hypothetical protein